VLCERTKGIYRGRRKQIVETQLPSRIISIMTSEVG